MTSMARKTTRRRDDTWVVKEDEFHPDPRVAAAAADDNAKLAAIRSLKEEILRNEIRREAAAGGTARRAFERERDRLHDEVRRIETEINDAAKEREQS
jgi:hypothetical protein